MQMETWLRASRCWKVVIKSQSFVLALSTTLAPLSSLACVTHCESGPKIEKENVKCWTLHEGSSPVT